MLWQEGQLHGLMHLLFRKRLRCALQDANYGLWIIGIISAAALAASAIIAFMEFFVSITGNAGRHTAGLAFPMGYSPSPEPHMCALQGHFGHCEELSVRNVFLCALRPNLHSKQSADLGLCCVCKGPDTHAPSTDMTR